MLKNYDDVNDVWDELLDMDLFTYEELQLLTNINGYSVDTLNDAIFSRYGYRDLNQMMGDE